MKIKKRCKGVLVSFFVIPITSPLVTITKKEALTAYVRSFVLRRLREIGETNGTDHGAKAQLARELGMTAANVSHWATGKHQSVGDDLRDKIAEMLHGGSVDKLNSAAMAAASAGSDEFPPQFDAALTFLRRTHGRDFTEAARALLQTASHRPENMTIDSLVAQIYERANEAKGKSVGGAVELTDDVIVGPQALKKKKANKT